MTLNLSQIDIKLLPILDALLQERSVSRAARVVGRSQPAVSHALRHLRTVFQNELLVRAGTGYELTSEAEAIAGPLHDALQQLNEVLNAQPSFDPATDDREFSIATSDYLSASILRPVIRQLALMAPGIKLSIVDATMPGIIPQLRSGSGWLAIYPADERPKVQDLHHEFLLTDSFCCASWAGNTAIGDELSKDNFTTLPHIIEFFTPTPDAVFSEKHFAAQGYPRSYIVRTPYIFLIPFLLQQTNALAVLPRRLAEPLREAADLRLYPLPFEAPAFDIEMGWCARYTADPAHLWLRSVIKDSARNL